MSLSSMPTGTISGGGSGSRTYPPAGTDPRPAPTETDSTRRSTGTPTSRQSTDATQRRTVDSLRRENEALRRANGTLRDKLDAVNRDQQDIVDHYERLLTEVNRDGAVGTSPRGHSARTESAEVQSVAKRVSATVRLVAGRLVTRVLRAVERR